MGRTQIFLMVAVFLGGCGDDPEETPATPSEMGGSEVAPTDPDAGRISIDAEPSDISDGGLDTDMGQVGGGAEAMDMDVPAPEDAAMPVDDAGSTDSDGSVGPPSIFTDLDEDEDGLDDGWETWAGEPGQLSPASGDTDGNGVSDGDEDFDGDGLTNLDEQSAGRYPTRIPTDDGPHPFRADILIEVDSMTDRSLDMETMEDVSSVFGAVSRSFFDGHPGIGVYFFPDEETVPVETFDGAFEPRQDLLEDHGPTFDAEANLPTEEMIHLVMATRRTDIRGRAGEVVTHPDNLRRSGVIIYVDELMDVFPMCGLDDPPPIPHVSYRDAMVGTIAHELGHILQLGHDTGANGGVNHFNVMSVPERCPDIRRHFLGEGNADVSQGATEAVGSPRLSDDAVELIRLDSKLGVDTSRLLDDGDGFEM